jgi:glycine/D-amino acid oxidase-like deaminating enzyme
MTIAVIGSGVAGLTAAHLLDPHHRVTVFEADDRVGGHAKLPPPRGPIRWAPSGGVWRGLPQRLPEIAPYVERDARVGRGRSVSEALSRRRVPRRTAARLGVAPCSWSWVSS